jgi:hypothetical protein
MGVKSHPTKKKKKNGTLGYGDFYPGHMQVIRHSTFVISKRRDQSKICERSVREIRKTDFVQKEFDV